MSDKELKDLIRTLDKNHKDLITKYNVLVKRTSSIITTINTINEKLDYLVETMSMFELIEEEVYEDFDPYSQAQEEYEEVEDEDEEEEE